MKKYLFLFMIIMNCFCYAHEHDNFYHSDLMASMKPGDKAALLLVHFGTTHDDTRALTIDQLTKKAMEAFPDLEIREAYTSRMINRRLKQRGIIKLNPAEALQVLKDDGFTHVIVQSSNIIEGIEMESIRRDVAALQDQFKDIRVGNPLLYSPEDYEAVIEQITSPIEKEEAVVLVGHGTYTPATAQYAMLDYMLKEKGFTPYYVTTVEGYPSFESTLIRLKSDGIKKVYLRPFMFVAGDHAKNDIADEMQAELIDNGFNAETLLEGLGQNEGIQYILIDHIRFCLTHKMQDIVSKKKQYEVSDQID